MALKSLYDGFGRKIDYLRMSVTDRCDLRCTYCMPQQMKFLPRRELLSLEELEYLAGAFIDRGVRKIRITGGEPLVRRDLMTLINHLGQRLDGGGLEELTLTTNATQLARFARDLKSYGVDRINVSLDTLDDENFTRLTRRRNLSDVLAGIDAAQHAGLKVKINTVALKAANHQELPSLIEWAHGRGMDLTLIEIMPLGEIEGDRVDQYLPLSVVRDELEVRWRLEPVGLRTGGPARYVRVAETGGLLGFITPLTNNFCADCNRVRVTCAGQLYTCLGDSGLIDLREAIRSSNPDEALGAAFDLAMIQKPERHSFDISSRDAKPSVARHMSVTGG